MSNNFPPIAAVLFMKYHSARVPGKNLRNICGKPLFYWVMNQLKKSKYLSRIIVDTDSKIIEEEVNKYFPDVVVYQRPERLYGDHIVANDILSNLMNVFEEEYYLQTHSTNPLLKARIIDDAIEQYFSNYSEYDSLFSVNELKSRLFDKDGKPINHNPDKLIMTQNLEPVYEENSNIYIFSRTGFQKHQNRIGKKPFIYLMNKEDSSDIDEEIDFQWCNYRLSNELKMSEDNNA